MRQIFKTRHLLQLLFIYTALESFRHIGWMLFYEQLIDNTRQEINLGFILYSGSIMITALQIPLIFRRLHIENNEKKLRLIFISSICGALVFRILQIFSGVISAYVFLVLWTFAIMVGICICYIHIFKSVPRAMIGWFFGAAYCVDVLIVSFVEQFTGTPAYFNASVIVGVVLCFVSVLFYIRHSKTNEPNLNEEYEWKPSKRFVRSAWIALILYVLIAGTLDNLYFFDERISLPTLGVYELPMMGVMYLIGGFLFAKVKPQITIPLAFVAICIAQSMTFFATGSLFSFSYSALSYLGSTLLEIATVVIPIWYARMSGRSYCFASFGEGLFYGGFAISSIWFLFLKQSAYHPVMGGILLAAISCLGLIIDLDTWETVQRVRQGKRRPTRMGEMDKFSGLVFCADCKSRHYHIRGTTLTEGQTNYICGTYRKKGKEVCTAHFIRTVVLDEVILQDLRRVTAFAKEHTQEFIRRQVDKSAQESKKELSAKRRELEKGKRRILELNGIFKKLYEDRVSGRLTDERFDMLSQDYENEQHILTARMEHLEQEIESQIEKVVNVDRFLKIVEKYTDIKELTPEILREFIERIEIHERSVYRGKGATQQIDIYYNFIGLMP